MLLIVAARVSRSQAHSNALRSLSECNANTQACDNLLESDELPSRTRKLCMALTASLNLQVDGLKAASDSEEDDEEDDEEDEDDEEEDY